MDNIAFDARHIWHPYSAADSSIPLHEVNSAAGAVIELTSGVRLIDAMASWWSVIHGYNHPVINQAATDQLQQFSHVMFGGLTHEPAITLCKTLVDITPEKLQRVFLSDSGSVSVEVAMKMAIQYWQAKGHSSKIEYGN